MIKRMTLAAALAGGATSNHDYINTTTRLFILERVWATASGKLKVEIQTGATTTALTTSWVGFNSTANPAVDVDCSGIRVATSGVVRVIRTNNDTAAQDVYSTIMGFLG
mgnify:CR=1 FL=1